MRRRVLTTAAAALSSLALLAPALAAGEKGLSKDEFDKLFKELRAPREPWQSLPWRLSVLEAQAQAVKEKKPVYMLVRSGHPLACV